MKTLHILNGDSTLEMFNLGSIEGECLVWREILCNGPVSHAIGNDEFWEERANFMNLEFEVDIETYRSKTKVEWQKLYETDWEEIVLWFEYDMFCQWNMMALLSFFHSQPLSKISLVCVGDELGTERKVGLAEIPLEMFDSLWKSRYVLTTSELQYAYSFWSFYTKGDLDGFFEHISEIPGVFKYLGTAVEHFFCLFPNKQGGLSQIDFRILEWIKSGVRNENQLVGKLLRENWDYGFGDLQYFKIIRRLNELIEVNDEILKLSVHGNAVVDRKMRYDGDLYKDNYLGGFERSKFEYDPDIQKIIPK